MPISDLMSDPMQHRSELRDLPLSEVRRLYARASVIHSVTKDKASPLHYHYFPNSQWLGELKEQLMARVPERPRHFAPTDFELDFLSLGRRTNLLGPVSSVILLGYDPQNGRSVPGVAKIFDNPHDRKFGDDASRIFARVQPTVPRDDPDYNQMVGATLLAEMAASFPDPWWEAPHSDGTAYTIVGKQFAVLCNQLLDYMTDNHLNPLALRGSMLRAITDIAAVTDADSLKPASQDVRRALLRKRDRHARKPLGASRKGRAAVIMSPSELRTVVDCLKNFGSMADAARMVGYATSQTLYVRLRALGMPDNKAGHDKVQDFVLHNHDHLLKRIEDPNASVEWRRPTYHSDHESAPAPWPMSEASTDDVPM